MILKNFLVYALVFFCSGACQRVESGESLAKRHCATCHQFPEPDLLDKATWRQEVFPEMAFRMGMDISRLPGTNPHELHEILQALPPEPLVSDAQWESIRAFYLQRAPDSLQQPSAREHSALHQFLASTLTLPVSGKNVVTMIRTDPHSEKIYVGMRDGNVYMLNHDLLPEDSLKIEAAPSDVLFSENASPLFLSMGLMDPNDQYRGALLSVTPDGKESIVLIDSLKRPVDIERADLDQDGDEDLLISAFGNFTGALLAFEKTGGGYHKHVIHHFPGTRKTITADFNDDGLPDILALITQGDEQIALFTNRGKFRFSYQVLLRFQPLYGSSYFELADFNGDGHPDILYANGDNADYSAILKPYHGLRIYLNDGRNHFKESWFHPMHGASMTKTEDFDKDGDLDIAAISFFPDFENHPEHGFIYFENNDGQFSAFHTPIAAASRWITIESTDIDSDGDADLLLGALAFPAAVPEDLFQRWGDKKTSLLVLKNTLY